MRAKRLAVAVAATALMIGCVHAAENGAPPSASQLRSQGDWRASKLSGVSVYNGNNEKIGDINDVLLDKNGKVAAVVLGVGGFLGVAERYVAVNFDQLKWVDQAVRTSSATGAAPATNVDSNSSTASQNNARVTTGAATSSTSADRWYPDHAVLNATKDQLKAMPEFKY